MLLTYYAVEAIAAIPWRKKKNQAQQYISEIYKCRTLLEGEILTAKAKIRANQHKTEQLIHQTQAIGWKSGLPQGTRLSVIPMSRYGRFRGRQALLEFIHDFLNPSQTQGACRILSIYGLGGIGKTQTALEFAYRSTGVFDIILWAEADTLFKLDSAYASFASALELMNEEELKKSQRLQVIKDVQHWLSTTGKRMLLPLLLFSRS